MVSNSQSNWTVRGGTFLVWAAAAASTGYWGLKLSANASAGPAVAQVARAPAPADPVAVARLLGQSTAPPAASPVASLASRFSLVGVVAGYSNGGAALIAVDGRPAKPFRVGTSVDDGLVLKAVEGRRAVLAASAEGLPVLTLELPALTR